MESPQHSQFTAICDPDLLQKYNVSGPRYTSYPTAAQFDSHFGEADFIAAAQAHSSATDPLSLYFHLPFCHSICYYCACNKIVTRDRSQSGIYLDYLKKEIEMLASRLQWQQRPITQLHWGGGTPTFLNDDEMRQLMAHTARHFKLLDQEEHEYSIEIDPRTIDSKRLKLLRELGFNRVSLGIQDFDPQVQDAVNRHQSLEDVTKHVEDIRARGFQSLNFDLIYGLPFQNEQTFAETIAKVVALSPDRISCYNYAHLPHRFKPQRSIDRQRLPSPDEKISMIGTVIEGLGDAGYLYVGMDHFVKPEDTLAKALGDHSLMRNFQGYSVNLAPDMLSMGVSSISSFPRAFAQNYRQVNDYYQALDQDRLPIEHGMTLTDEDVMRRDIIQQITCHRQLDFTLVAEQYSIDFQQHFAGALAQLQPLADDNIIELNAESLTVTGAGALFLRHVAMAFDEYLGQPSQGQVTFSKTI